METEPIRQIVFVTGGTRSGKSRYAQQTVENWPGALLYIATAEVLDEEMRQRVQLHQADRGERWHTCEEPLDLGAALKRAEDYGGALLDCLTLWTSNLMGRYLEDDAGIEGALDGFLQTLKRFPGRLCIVTNEVGCGIVPENAMARRFRDWAGKINQAVAARADRAYWVVAGRPVRLGESLDAGRCTTGPRDSSPLILS